MYFGEQNEKDYRSLQGLRDIRIVRTRRHERYRLNSSSYEEEVSLDAAVVVANGPNAVTDHLYVVGQTAKGREKRYYACPYTRENVVQLQAEIRKAQQEEQSE